MHAFRIALRRVLAAQELHHHVRAVCNLPEIEHMDDVAVFQGGGRTSFVQESGFHLFVSRVLALQYLDRNGFTRHPISCAVDIRHSAAEAFQQLVFAENYKILMTNTW
jgi:hypothetical protein